MPSSPIHRHWLAHWFGCGLVPKAPGTAGSLGALPLHYALGWVNAPMAAALIVALCGLGVYASSSAAKAIGNDDPSWVVIDEVCGTLIACWFVRDYGILAVLIAFVLFRLLDITKPWIIDRVQHLGPPGVSIMADDVLAGIGAGLGAWGAAYFI